MEYSDEIIEHVVEAKNDRKKMNELIESYRLLIASEISKIQNSYIDPFDDELMSIGMMAFYEAVKSYNPSKGAFVSLARTIIRHRVVDFYRKEKKSIIRNKIYLNDIEINKKSLSIFNEESAKYERIVAIKEFSKILSEWNINFSKLADASPKSKKLKSLYKEMAKYLYDDSNLIEEIKKYKRLPIQILVDKFQVNRKKVERGRIFIISCIILMDEKYKVINDYVK